MLKALKSKCIVKGFVKALQKHQSLIPKDVTGLHQPPSCDSSPRNLRRGKVGYQASDSLTSVSPKQTLDAARARTVSQRVCGEGVGGVVGSEASSTRVLDR